MTRLFKKIIGTALAVMLLATQLVASLAVFTSPVYGAEARVTSITADVNELSFEGGKVNLSVEGEGLTANNWDLSIDVCYGGTNSIVSANAKASTVDIIEKTSKGALINISPNGMKSGLDIVVHAAAAEGDASIELVETRIVVNSKNYKTATIEPTRAELESGNVVKVTFEDEVVELADSQNSYQKVSFTTQDNKSYILTDEDEITASDDSITISLHDSLYTLLDCSSSSVIKIVFGERAMKLKSLPDNTYNQEFFWVIQTKAAITSIALDKDVFDNEGGKVTATLSGPSASSINLKDIDADVLIAGSNKSANLAITKGKESDGNPTITFTVPANTGKQTQSYYLNIKVNGSPVYQATTENKANLAIVSVVPEGTSTDAATISSVTITANGGGTPIDGGVETTVSKSIGSLKTEIRLFGTGLNDTTTKLRITDENGVEWPVYDIAECDGTWRFLALSGIRKNGIFGNGNTQIIELLPARYAGTNKTYTIEIAPDGKHFDKDSKIKLRINNEGINDETDFRDCSANNFKYIDVQYVDESGREIAKADRYKCYEISMPKQFVKAKEIDGYEVVTEPVLDEWVKQGRSYKYIYKKIAEPDDPKYNDVPGYQKKNVFETSTNTIRDLKLNGNYSTDLEFKVFNTTTQELETTVKPENGALPDLKLKKNHNYIIFALNDKYYSKTYVWNDNGVLKDIKSNYSSSVPDSEWQYNTVSSLEVASRSTKTSDDDRYSARLQVYIGSTGTGPAVNKTFKLVSAFETVTAKTKSDGMLTAYLLEDIAYTVTVDDPVYGVQAFPLVVKDKREYGSSRYTYDHSTCHSVGLDPSTNRQKTPIRLVEKSKSHDEDTTITSGTGKTTVSGFKFNDLIVKENKVSTSVNGLVDNTYDVISVKVINPHRWEVCKIATGEFTIAEKYDQARDVKNVYLLKDDGSIEAVNYTLKSGKVEFATTSLSLYPIVIEYEDQSEDVPEFIEEVSDRVSGATRYDTALNAADELKKISGIEKFDSIIVANGENYPDALTGGYLAKVKAAPIILVGKSSESKVKSYIDINLNKGGVVYILGAQGAVSKNFESSVVKSGITVKRLGGATRYDTNIEILKEAGVSNEELLISTGTNFADSLSASAVGRPILLVGKGLTASQKKYLKTLNPEKITALGGVKAVSEAVLNEVAVSVTGRTATDRLSGSTRFETSVKIAERYFKESPSSVILSTGKNFPDGLSGGPLAAKLGAPLILVSETDYAAAQKYCNNAGVNKSVALGGTRIVSEKVRKNMLSQ